MHAESLTCDIAKELKLYGEMHRFIPALASDLGASIAELPVNHRPREKGRSKYGIFRTVRVVLDLLTVKFFSSYSTRPGHLFGLCGLVCTVNWGGNYDGVGAAASLLPTPPRQLAPSYCSASSSWWWGCNS